MKNQTLREGVGIVWVRIDDLVTVFPDSQWSFHGCLLLTGLKFAESRTGMTSR